MSAELKTVGQVFPDEKFDDSDLHLIHFNMFQKPWNYDNVLYEEYFWKYAKETDFYNEISQMKGNYTDEERKRDNIVGENLLNQSKRISASDFTFKNHIGKDYFKFMD